MYRPGQGLRHARFGAGDGRSRICEGGDGRCTAYGRTIRRGRAADGDPGAPRHAETARKAVTPPHTATGTARPSAPTTRPTAATTTARGRSRPGGPGERAALRHDDDARRDAAPPPRTGDAARQAPGPRAGHPDPDPPTPHRPGLRGLRHRLRARLGRSATRPRHGRLRAQRGGRHRGRVLLPVRAQPPRPLSTGLAAVRPLLRDGLARQPDLGLVRGRPRRPGAEPQLRRPVLPVLRPARPRRPPRAGDQARLEGRLGLPRAGRLADRRLAAHALLEPRPRAGRQVRGHRRRAHGAVPGVPAPGHRAGQHGPRPALPQVLGEPHSRQHRRRRARAHGDVRRPVHLAPAAQRLPLRPAPGRGLVRRLPPAGVRALGRDRHPHRGPREPVGRRPAHRPRAHPGPRPPPPGAPVPPSSGPAPGGSEVSVFGWDVSALWEPLAGSGPVLWFGVRTTVPPCRSALDQVVGRGGARWSERSTARTKSAARVGGAKGARASRHAQPPRAAR